MKFRPVVGATVMVQKDFAIIKNIYKHRHMLQNIILTGK
jgi:hypothetical protein